MKRLKVLSKRCLKGGGKRRRTRGQQRRASSLSMRRSRTKNVRARRQKSIRRRSTVRKGGEDDNDYVTFDAQKQDDEQHLYESEIISHVISGIKRRRWQKRTFFFSSQKQKIKYDSLRRTQPQKEIDIRLVNYDDNSVTIVSTTGKYIYLYGINIGKFFKGKIKIDTTLELREPPSILLPSKPSSSQSSTSRSPFSQKSKQSNPQVALPAPTQQQKTI